ncbi:MAG: protein-(glutamine-N5) methyltransferase, ribosomal protein L3-specific [Verrucomicrobiaceae bacterium]|nr:protein-(glutamine-N5) methyltransferase, ribosomal protein L3-specific [Verrucomicrobiaceae bacterium]
MDTREQLIEQLHTLRDYVRWGMTQFQRTGIFYGHGTDNAFDEALALILHTLHLEHEYANVLLDARLTKSECEQVLTALETRFQKRLPMPYITGEANFADYPFYVDKRVLIPRSPIAELIETGFEPWLAGRYPQRILDLCTGSGCIGIACALYLDETSVTLSDISADALIVAERNIERHAVETRVRVVQSDLFTALRDERFDLIVSNPPYVDAPDFTDLPAEYRHEPRLALAAGDDGLDLVRIMLREAAQYLNDDGVLIAEVGNSWIALEAAYPLVPFTWLEFERGGHGVFLLTREQLIEHAAEF